MKKRQTVCLWICLLALLGTAGIQPVLPVDATVTLPAETKYIALTFDDGPRRGTTDVLLDGLKARGASATFFLVGDRIAGNEDLVLRMAAEGHQVGNHTWSHVRLQGAEEAVIREEIQRTNQLLAELLGEGTYWLRPPYGLIDESQRALVPVPMVKWSVDPLDWESRNTEKVLQAIMKAAKPGAIILLHDIYKTSVEAALKAVDALQAQGYWFVTVEELLTLNGIEAQPGVLYRSGTGI